jgi:hypothetical protein
MENTSEMLTFNSASACRVKAAALRKSACEASSPALTKVFLDIAKRWDELAMDFETSMPIRLNRSQVHHPSPSA